MSYIHNLLVGYFLLVNKKIYNGGRRNGRDDPIKQSNFCEKEGKLLEALEKPNSFASVVAENQALMQGEQIKRFLQVLKDNGFLKSSECKNTNNFFKYKIPLINPSKFIEPDSISLLFKKRWY